MSRRALATLCLSCAVLLLGACADLKALTSLVAALQGEYHVPVNVNRSGTHLVLLLGQFPDAKAGPDERAEFARGVARFARAHYADAATLTDIRVGTVRRSGAGPVTLTKTEVPYRFTIAELDDTTHGVAGPASDVHPPPVPSR